MDFSSLRYCSIPVLKALCLKNSAKSWEQCLNIRFPVIRQVQRDLFLARYIKSSNFHELLKTILERSI